MKLTRKVYNKTLSYVPSNVRSMSKFYWDRVFFRPYTIKRNISDMDFKFYIADPLAKQWYDTGDPDWREMDYLKSKLIEKNDVILECGAHQGVTTCYLSKSMGGSGKVIAFEPNPFNAAVIAKNLKLNKIKNVSIINKAIGEKKSEINFSFFSNSTIEKSLVGTRRTMTTSIDDYLKFKPTFLKIDVEGYEVEALRGAKKTLATKPKLAIEIHTSYLPRFEHTVKDVFDLLDLRDYDCTIMGPSGFGKLGRVEDIKTHVHLFAVPKKK